MDLRPMELTYKDIDGVRHYYYEAKAMQWVRHEMTEHGVFGVYLNDKGEEVKILETPEI